MGATTRTPCPECKFLGSHAMALSKTMFCIDKEGVLTMHARNKNGNLVRVNGLVCNGGEEHQLHGGDILTIGRYSSVPWMTLHVKATRVVTPETKKLPAKKRTKRQRDGVGQDESWGETSMGDAKEPFWLKTKSRKRLCVLQGNAASPSKEDCRPRSQDDLFSSLESVDLPKVTPQPRMKRQRHIRDEPSPNDCEQGSMKRRIFLARYSPGKRSKNWGDDLSPEQSEESPLSKASLVEDEGNGDDMESRPKLPVTEQASGGSSSCRKSLETQDGEQRDSLPCSVVEGTMLSLPVCPTYDGESSDMEESHFIGGQQHLEKPSAEKESVQEQEEAPPRFATDLSTKDWNEICNEEGVRRSLANLVVAQRLLRKDDDWLPEMLQNTLME